MNNSVNIFLLCNGLGQRFKEDGYFLPKPLVYVHGKHLIFYAIDEILKVDGVKLFILYNRALEYFQFENLIRNQYGLSSIHFLQLDDTRGAADTLLQGLEHFHLNAYDSFISLDCDILFSKDSLIQFKNNPNNTIFYFRDKSEKPIYSYIKTRKNKVIDIAEKQKISDFACCGVYGFNNVKDYKICFNKILSNNTKEIYISYIYKELLNINISIDYLEIKDYHCLGTPLLLQTYCLNSKPKEKKRICFDIDNTLFTLAVARDYKNISPINKNIELLKNLYKDGHTIILYTARNMKTAGGNIGLAMKTAAPDIFDLLKEYNIPYSEIHFKPHFDFLIDDLAVNTFSDLNKETGFYFVNTEVRPGNKIIFTFTTVIKETANEGEIFFYQNIPPSIKNLFPLIHSIDSNKITLEKINGVSLDFLDCKKQLTKEHIELLFKSLDSIHKCIVVDENVDIYSNYLPKLKDRADHLFYKEIKYNNLIFDELTTRLQQYQEKKLAIKGVCHGDPVFTNIFLCKNSNLAFLKFIDPRGKLGNQNTILGDIMYDYAKIYQSICGYNFIFNGLDIDKEYITKNKEIFKNLFVHKFSQDRFDWLRVLTKGLIYSMLPFHQEKEKRNKYIEVCMKLV